MAFAPEFTLDLLRGTGGSSPTISGDVMWEAGAARFANGRRDGANYFAVRITRADITPHDTPWGGTIQISTINKAGVEIDEDLVGESTSDSVGPIGVYNINLVRALDYKFRVITWGDDDPGSIHVRLEFYS